MIRKNAQYTHALGEYFSPLDKLLTIIHRSLFLRYKKLSIIASFAMYVSIMLFLGNLLRISSNYFILLPLMTVIFSYGLVGGVVIGLLGLPLNLLMFHILGHPEYAPESLIIAELFGIIIGVAMGYLSDFFSKLNREIHKRRITEEKLRKTLADKEILLEEIHHRVRNNLNIIKSLISLQLSRVSDPAFKEECEKLKQRIFSISLVHDQLFHQNNSVSLDLKEYLSSLLDNLLSLSIQPGVRLDSVWPQDPLSIESDKAIYIGLIVQEVVINALKYAFQGTEFPELNFKLALQDDQIHISITDNGCGFDPAESSDGLGMKLIYSLSCQLNGSFGYKKGRGTVFTLDFPFR